MIMGIGGGWLCWKGHNGAFAIASGSREEAPHNFHRL